MVKVLTLPGRSSANAYSHLLADALEAAGAEVLDWSERTAIRGTVDVVHLHWPASTLNRSRWSAAALHTARRLAAIVAARRRGATVVWTVHNLASHDVRHARSERAFWRALPRLVDGWLSLTASALDDIEAAYPGLAGKPRATVPMGHFREAYPDRVDRDTARATLRIARDARVLAHIGRIRPYKGVPALVDAFAGLDDADAVLLVAGACPDAELADRLREAAGRDDRVHLRLGRVPDDALAAYLRAADLVVLPFEEILNSSSALLALSFDVPVLVPTLGAMPELAAEVGGDWVRLYDGPLRPEHLEEGLAAGRPQGRPDLDRHDWAAIATATLDLYARAGATATGRRR